MNQRSASVLGRSPSKRQLDTRQLRWSSSTKDLQYPATTTAAAVNHHLKKLEAAEREKVALQQNPRLNRLRQFVETDFFNATVGVIIFLNAFLVGFETDHPLGSGAGSLSWYAEVLFFLVYTTELSLRAFGHGVRPFLASMWNVFDVLLVVTSGVDTFVLEPLFGGTSDDVEDIDGDAALSILVMFRLLRIFRILRMVRLVRPIWLIVFGIGGSARAIVWSCIMLAIVVFIFGLVATHWVSAYVDDPEMVTYFGTVSKSMFTMFQILTFDNWNEIARATMKHSRASILLFTTFLAATSWSMLNVIVGILVESTIQAARKKNENEGMLKISGHEEACREFQELFNLADLDRSGKLTSAELEAACSDAEFRAKLRSLKISREGVKMLFDVLDVEGTGEVDALEFIESMLGAQSCTSKKDMLALSFNARRIKERMEAQTFDVSRDCANRFAETQRRLAALSYDATRLVQVLTAPRSMDGNAGTIS